MSPKAFIFADFHLGQGDLQRLSASVSSVRREECRATGMAGCLAVLLCQATSLLLVVACGWDVAYLLSGGIMLKCPSHRHQGGKLLSEVSEEKLHLCTSKHHTHNCTVSSWDTHIYHVNLQGDTIYTLFALFTITLTIPNVFLDRAECTICRRKGRRRLTVGGVSREMFFCFFFFEGGVALWTFCSSDWPLRKHSVPSGAGTGRLHLERYQVFKNKGMCFPFAADLSTEIFLLQSCKCFHLGCWEGVSNFLSSISGWFPVCRGLLIVCV